MGYQTFVSATVKVRPGAATEGVPFPADGVVRTTHMIVQAPENNTATVFLRFQATMPDGHSDVDTQFSMYPLTAGQKITFRGLARGDGPVRAISFGTGYSYMLGKTGAQRLLINYAKET